MLYPCLWSLIGSICITETIIITGVGPGQPGGGGSEAQGGGEHVGGDQVRDTQFCTPVNLYSTGGEHDGGDQVRVAKYAD